VREDAELLAEHGGVSGSRSRQECLPELRFVGEDRRIGYPGVHRVEAHRPRLVEQSVERSLQSTLLLAFGRGDAAASGADRSTRGCGPLVCSGDGEGYRETNGHQITPP